MKKLIETSAMKTVIQHTDAHIPGRYVFETIHHDDVAQDKIDRFRAHGGLKQGAKLSVMDNAPITYAITVPDVDQWARFKLEQPDLVAGLRSRDRVEREKAARMILILKPNWSMIDQKGIK